MELNRPRLMRRRLLDSSLAVRVSMGEFSGFGIILDELIRREIVTAYGSVIKASLAPSRNGVAPEGATPEFDSSGSNVSSIVDVPTT